MPTSLKFTHAHYSFLSLLPTSESLAIRGKLLNDTAAQRQTKMRAADSFVVVNVRHPVAKLEARFDDSTGNNEDEMAFYCGEIREEYFEIHNLGKSIVSDIWVVLPWDGTMRIKADGTVMHLESRSILTSTSMKLTESPETSSPNTLVAPEPYRLSSGPLAPGDSVKLPIQIYFRTPCAITHSILLVYRQVWPLATIPQPCHEYHFATG